LASSNHEQPQYLQQKKKEKGKYLNMGKKVQIGYGVDVDAVSGWIGSYGGEDSISDISRGLQAGEQNVHRLLKMFKKYNMTQTFYIPGHSLETFPKECQAIRDVSSTNLSPDTHDCKGAEQ
jgi:peptidoglycan/xylan/chitin deacetylase (PgdA/CDA1 family)